MPPPFRSRSPRTVERKEFSYLSLPLFASLGFEPLLDCLALLSSALLDSTDQLIEASFSLHKIVVRDAAPFPFDLTSELLQLAFHYVLVHVLCLLAEFEITSGYAAIPKESCKTKAIQRGAERVEVVVNQCETAGNLFRFKTGPGHEEFFRFCSEKASVRIESAAKVRGTPLTDRTKATAKRGTRGPRIQEHGA
jgi:hypothetical protein